MEKAINEEVLCVLRKNNITNLIEIDYVDLEKAFSKSINDFSNICNDSNSSLEEIINFISINEDLKHLEISYHYCDSLSSSYQAFFKASNKETISEIMKKQELMLLNQKNSPDTYNMEKDICNYKQYLKKKYILWTKAYSINQTYKLCQEDKNILIFSHRMDGYSNPVYQLTTNLSIEIKTNFGYGRASYFYTKLKYKNIEITPFSEWIYYEFAKFAEIVRYTKSHILLNECWLEAMEFSKCACNLSLSNEEEFLEKYIFKECEDMVSGLEDIFKKEHFLFKNIVGKKYTIDKRGHVLVEFRGEKISGALDFISKILEFDNIVLIKSFITRIEECNKSIQLILVDESRIIKVKISNLTHELNDFKVQNEILLKKENYYIEKREEVETEIQSNLHIHMEDLLRPNFLEFITNHISKRVDDEFNEEYPEYKSFKAEHLNVNRNIRTIYQQIQNLTNVDENIIAYNRKIIQYFEKQKISSRSSRCSEGQSRSLDKKDFQSATNEITLR